MEPGLQVKDMT